MFLDALGARAILAATGLANVVVISRGAGVDVYGIYATATGYSTILAALTDLGSSAVVVREGVRADHGGVERTYLQLRIALTVIVATAGAAAVPIVFPQDAQLAALVGLGLVVFSGPSIGAPLGQLRSTMTPFRTGVVIQAVLTLLLTLALFVAAGSPQAAELVAAPAIAAAVATGYSWVAMRGWIPNALRRVDARAALGMLRSMWLIGLSGALTAAFVRVDALLLLRLSGPASAGIYSAAYRFLEQTRLVPTALLYPVSPITAREIANNGRVAIGTDRVLLRVSLAGGVGLTCITSGLAPLLARLLGPGFSESETILVVMSAVAAWSLIAFVATSKVINSHQERPFVAVSAAALVINVGLNALLIPRYGAHGAAIAGVVTALLATCALVVLTRSVSTARFFLGLGLSVASGLVVVLVSLAVDGALSSAAQHVWAVVLTATGVGLLAQSARAMRSQDLAEA